MTIKAFKGFVLPKIHNHVIKTTPMSIGELEDLLKYSADLTDVSCADMSPDQLDRLIESSKQLAMQLGYDIDNDPSIDLNFDR